VLKVAEEGAVAQVAVFPGQTFLVRQAVADQGQAGNALASGALVAMGAGIVVVALGAVVTVIPVTGAAGNGGVAEIGFALVEIGELVLAVPIGSTLAIRPGSTFPGVTQVVLGAVVAILAGGAVRQGLAFTGSAVEVQVAEIGFTLAEVRELVLAFPVGGALGRRSAVIRCSGVSRINVLGDVGLTVFAASTASKRADDPDDRDGGGPRFQ